MQTNEQQPNARLPYLLRRYQDRLLYLDRRNPAMLIRRIIKVRTFDVAALDYGTSAHYILSKLLRGSTNAVLFRDSDTREDADAIRNHLRTLRREAKRTEEETGLADLGIGFPFVVGHGGDFYFRGPLLIWSCELEQRRGQRNAGWHVVPREGEERPTLNRALLAGLRKMSGIDFTESISDELEEILDMDFKREDDALEVFLQRLSAVLHRNDIPLSIEINSSIVPLVEFYARDEQTFEREPLHLERLCILGRFPQGSEAIFQDYEALIKWSSTQSSGFGAIGELLDISDPAPNHLCGFSGQDSTLDEIPARNLGLVLESDASQDEAIIHSQRAPVTVIRGPPGTGKSQVITNLISDALNREERVLVVCQKRAALDVVYERLQEVGLDDVALLVHDSQKDRKALYNKLAGIISLESTDWHGAQSSYPAASRVDQAVSKLNKITSPLWKDHRGYRVKELYSLAQQGHRTSAIQNKSLFNVDREVVEDILSVGGDLVQAALRYEHQTIWKCRQDLQSATIADQRRMEDSIRLILSEFDKGAVVISDPTEHQNTLDSYQSHFKSNISILERLNIKRFFEYRRAKRTARNLCKRQGIPIDDGKVVIEQLKRGERIHGALGNLNPWLRQKNMGDLYSQCQDSSDRAIGFLSDLLAHFSEFQTVVQYDRDMESVRPEAREFIKNTAKLFNPEDFKENGAVHQEFLQRWIHEVEEKYPALSGDPFSLYRRAQRELKEAMEESRGILAKELRNKYYLKARTPVLPPGHHHPNRKAATDWNRLRGQFQLKRRIKPIRKLYQDERFRHIWPRISKCWLTSPEACSAIFPLKRGMFDLVIFDEASQLAVERGIPAIYRGKRVVIAGDEQQLRPFDQFRMSIDEEEGEEDSFEAESLLILAKNTYTTRYLTWHYRSRFQELIDFSNHAYYEGLLQIAASNDHTSKPLNWHKVAGLWDDQQNVVEAERVVDLLKEAIDQDHQPTVGIVTFNRKQRDLVSNVVDARCERDPQFYEAWLRAENPPSGRLDDKPFVKNIENVQGDERDIIIFTTAYAPGPDGKMRFQFGLFSQEGGQNRLNVAITRAKYQVHVVSSVDPEVFPDTSTHLGPRHLKRYLEYVRAVSEGKQEHIKAVIEELNPGFSKDKDSSSVKVFESPFEEEVYNFVQGLGFSVDTQVGYSSYRLDLAIAHPEYPDRYLAAIECDGATFHSAKSARERDVYRQRFLERHGWQVLRVWSRDWFYNQDECKRRLRKDLESLVSRTEKPQRISKLV